MYMWSRQAFWLRSRISLGGRERKQHAGKNGRGEGREEARSPENSLGQMQKECAGSAGDEGKQSGSGNSTY